MNQRAENRAETYKTARRSLDVGVETGAVVLEQQPELIMRTADCKYVDPRENGEQIEQRHDGVRRKLR